MSFLSILTEAEAVVQGSLGLSAFPDAVARLGCLSH